MTHTPCPRHSKNIIIPHAILFQPQIQATYQNSNIPVSWVSFIIIWFQPIVIFTEGLQNFLSLPFMCIKPLLPLYLKIGNHDVHSLAQAGNLVESGYLVHICHDKRLYFIITVYFGESVVCNMVKEDRSFYHFVFISF